MKSFLPTHNGERQTAAMAGLCVLIVAISALTARAANPRSVALTIQENGRVRISETHDLPPASAQGLYEIAPLPETILPSTVQAAPLERGASLEILSQRFSYALADGPSLFRAALGQKVAVDTGDGATKEGTLLTLPDWSAAHPSFLMEGMAPASGLTLIPDVQALASMAVQAPRKASIARTPTLYWTLAAGTPPPSAVQLNYAASGLSWEASHDAILSGDSRSIALSTRVRIHNDTVRAFDRATIRLALTEKALFAPLVPDASDPRAASAITLRFAEDGRSLLPERTAASAAVIANYDIPTPLSLPPDDDIWASLASFPSLPVTAVLRYDGARFDRFQRNRRADEAFGAESSSTVETRLTFRNEGKTPLPPGPFRVLRGDPSVPLEWVGTDWLPALPPGDSVTLRLGPAAGLSGKRLRKAFTEIEPLKSAEESFEITLENHTLFDREIEVIEHLYRGDTYEIIAADAPYTPGPVPSSIRFALPVKAGSTRSLTYTVRYRW